MRNSFLVSSLSRLTVSLLCSALAVVDLDCTATACAQQPAATHGMTMPAAAIAPQDLPPPIAMSGIGNSHLQITTSNPQAQVWFNQGLNLLHDFWDYESSRAFEQSVRLDPNCAMCYWGVYQAEWFRGEDKTWHRVALKQAARLAKHASPQEKLYIRAAQQEQKEQDRKPSKSSRLFVGNSRKAAHSDSSQSPHIDSPETVTLRKLVALLPHDTQARIFLAESLMDGFDKKSNPKSGTVQGQAILSSILAAHPDDSAANHYWIHAVEPGLHPELALDSAAKLGSLAPSSGHMVHMPGHIYYRLGDYETARASFLNSEHTDESYMRDQHVAADDDWNYVHNLMYLIADLLEAGQIQEATAVSSRLNTARGSRGATLYLGSPRDGITRLDLDLPVALRSADWPRVIAMLKRSSPPAISPIWPPFGLPCSTKRRGCRRCRTRTFPPQPATAAIWTRASPRSLLPTRTTCPRCPECRPQKTQPPARCTASSTSPRWSCKRRFCWQSTRQSSPTPHSPKPPRQKKNWATVSLQATSVLSAKRAAMP